MAYLLLAVIYLILYLTPDPPTKGFGVGLFGRAIMSWPTTNALALTISIVFTVLGLKELIWT